jgi:hypothetical protein
VLADTDAASGHCVVAAFEEMQTSVTNTVRVQGLDALSYGDGLFAEMALTKFRPASLSPLAMTALRNDRVSRSCVKGPIENGWANALATNQLSI